MQQELLPFCKINFRMFIPLERNKSFTQQQEDLWTSIAIFWMSYFCDSCQMINLQFYHSFYIFSCHSVERKCFLSYLFISEWTPIFLFINVLYHYYHYLSLRCYKSAQWQPFKLTSASLVILLIILQALHFLAQWDVYTHYSGWAAIYPGLFFLIEYWVFISLDAGAIYIHSDEC